MLLIVQNGEQAVDGVTGLVEGRGGGGLGPDDGVEEGAVLHGFVGGGLQVAADGVVLVRSEGSLLG